MAYMTAAKQLEIFKNLRPTLKENYVNTLLDSVASAIAADVDTPPDLPAIADPALMTAANTTLTAVTGVDGDSDADSVADGLVLTASPQVGLETGFADPDYPTLLIVTGIPAGGTLTGDVKIYGTDIADEEQDETVVLNGSDVVLGTLVFKTITALDLPARTTADDAIDIGWYNAGSKATVDARLATQETFNDQVRADLAAIRTCVNAFLASARTADWIATS